jgi:hypothetical protein
MKVWFGTTTLNWNSHKKSYFEINNYLKQLGCVILFDWIEDADKFYNTNYKDRNIGKIFQEVIQAIDEADAVVIEYTVPNFSSSHQINYALLKKKPTLVMRQIKDNPRFSDSYLEALQLPFLTVKDYTPKNYKEILEEFIGLSSMEQGLQRYNIVLDAKQKHYLDWASYHFKKSRSEIIRELIDNKILTDKDYKKSRI